MHQICRECTFNKNINRYPEGADSVKVAEYQERLCALLEAKADEWKTPEMGYNIKLLRKEIFHETEKDFTDIKRHYNALMLAYEDKLAEQVRRSPDPLAAAIRFAMAGNYVDFAALPDVNEEQLWALLGEADNTGLDMQIYKEFAGETAKARKLTYLTDNCGEIVIDKVLIGELKRRNPNLEVTVMVRGLPMAADAVVEDALQVGMDSLGTVLGNGSPMDGTILSAISGEELDTLNHADVVISKGQANYEALAGCGLNIFYLFICKCALFMERFKVPKFGGILTREDRTAQYI